MMDELDTAPAGLCIDPAHLAHTNSDPVDALKTYMSAVRYMHLKDTRVDPALKGYDRYAAFCELGAGVVDLPGLVDVLLDDDYAGLAIIELDASQKTAEQSTLESIDYVRDTLGLVLTPRSGGMSAAPAPSTGRRMQAGAPPPEAPRLERAMALRVRRRRRRVRDDPAGRDPVRPVLSSGRS